MLLREHLCLLLPFAAETLRRSTKLLKESSLDKQIIKKLHSKNNSCERVSQGVRSSSCFSDLSGS